MELNKSIRLENPLPETTGRQVRDALLQAFPRMNFVCGRFQPEGCPVYIGVIWRNGVVHHGVHRGSLDPETVNSYARHNLAGLFQWGDA